MSTILPRLPGAPATTLPPEQVAKTAKAAQEFEAMALGQMLAPMFQTVDSAHGALGGGTGEETWKPMLVTELGKQVARAGGVGLARPVMEQMLRTQEARSEAAVPDRAGRDQTAVEQLLLERPALQRTTAQPDPRPGA